MKIVKKHIDYMLGFPVEFDEVFAIEVAGDLVPLIDYETLQLKALEHLSDKPGRLTGAEIRFIRKFLGMTLAKFGQQFGVTHSAVKKWENGTQMNWGSEAFLRLLAHRASGKSFLEPLLDSLTAPRKDGDAFMLAKNAEINRNVTRLLDPDSDKAAISFIEKRLALQWMSSAISGEALVENAGGMTQAVRHGGAFKRYKPDGDKNALADAA